MSSAADAPSTESLERKDKDPSDPSTSSTFSRQRQPVQLHAGAQMWQRAADVLTRKRRVKVLRSLADWFAEGGSAAAKVAKQRLSCFILFERAVYGQL